jgi:hypothetical protein
MELFRVMQLVGGFYGNIPQNHYYADQRIFMFTT